MIGNFDSPMVSSLFSLPSMTPSGGPPEGGLPSLDELIGGKPSFADADVNGDGGLSIDEFSAVAPGKADAEALFASIDADGDGALTEAERDAFAADIKDRITATISEAMSAFSSGVGGDGADLVSQLLETMENGSDEQEEAQSEASLDAMASRFAEQAYARVTSMIAA